MSEMKQDELVARAPWYVSGVRTRHNAMPVLQIISEPTGEVLALIPYSDRTSKIHTECYADAHLIAAAPEILAALRSARSTLDRLYEGFLHNSEAGCEAWDDASGFEVGRQLDAVIAKAEGRQP